MKCGPDLCEGACVCLCGGDRQLSLQTFVLHLELACVTLAATLLLDKALTPTSLPAVRIEAVGNEAADCHLGRLSEELEEVPGSTFGQFFADFLCFFD